MRTRSTVVPHPQERHIETDATTHAPVHDDTTPTPDPSHFREILDAIIEYWRAGYGQVTSPDGIPEDELTRGGSVKDLLAGELHADAISKYSNDTLIVGTYDNGFDRVGVIVREPDGTEHRGQARATRVLRLGQEQLVTVADIVWEEGPAPARQSPPAWLRT